MRFLRIKTHIAMLILIASGFLMLSSQNEVLASSLEVLDYDSEVMADSVLNVELEYQNLND